MANIVFIATSLDGYIADKNGGLDWLHAIPNPEHVDMGFGPLMERVDALVMGRNTFETVAGFDCEWPYTKPVFVLSNTLTQVPAGYEEKIELVRGPLQQVVTTLNQRGFAELYIDGGITIQQFLHDDLIDEMILTTIPVLLGGGAPLFGELAKSQNFKLAGSDIFLDAIVQSHYIRQR